ncbi:polyphosphate kinase 2 [Xylophilus sp. Leaf220]|uniref:polyphosphate kinase 2 n=1 Tax=Xylophilus sp. Leaf220 TaxID=1735686 RepID=UPI0006FEAA22|nr:polyphosphate kinase 2 [Xylophilus sp. Leaf220]KQM68638.1 polyphosphate kinase [Xylophilus sp. Leaf220]
MKSFSRKDYARQLEPLQIELARMARWAAATGQRILVIFEGRDTAGKGGAIGAVSEHLNPRQCRVVALPKPTDRERGQWYFQRYATHLPAAGEIVLFDRSWYNRAGVEKVMGYATDAQVEAFLRQVPVFEQMLVDDGILLFKYWLGTDQDEQEARFAERHTDPLKRWKLSPIDLEARKHYADYTAAREAMLQATHTPQAPWTLVDFNDQRAGRLTLLRDLLDRLPDTHIEDDPMALEPLVRKPLKERYGVVKPLKTARPGKSDGKGEKPEKPDKADS